MCETGVDVEIGGGVNLERMAGHQNWLCARPVFIGRRKDDRRRRDQAGIQPKQNVLGTSCQAKKLRESLRENNCFKDVKNLRKEREYKTPASE